MRRRLGRFRDSSDFRALRALRDERWVADSAQPCADLLVVDELPLIQKAASIYWASVDVAALSTESEGCCVSLLLGPVMEGPEAPANLLGLIWVFEIEPVVEPEPVQGELSPQVLVGHASDLLRTTAFRHGLKDIGPVWLRHLQACQDCCELSVVLRLCNGEGTVIGGQRALLTVENSSLFPRSGQLCPEPKDLGPMITHFASFESTFFFTLKQSERQAIRREANRSNKRLFLL